MILFFFYCILSCFDLQSNVYLGIAKSNDGSNSKVQQRAIKVFKTSILVFKDRARYIEVGYYIDHRNLL